jgi:pimeloyl-ACP methyl ester carboxylesterase
VPAALVKDGVLDGTATDSLKAVDVFYIYPTVTGFRPETEVCDMTDTMMVAGAQMVRQIQTGVFDESCNVFMPLYRQISMPKPGSDYSAIIDYVSGFDATDALDYFLNNLNQGRPFILAGHSQGASVLIALLENYMTKHPEALKRMVAAYPIGFADARVDTVRGSVVVTSITNPALYAIPADGAEMFGPQSYHLHDYGFFFNNIKQNVADRIKAYMEK